MMALGVKRARRFADDRRDPPTALAVAVALGRLVEQATRLGLAIDRARSKYLGRTSSRDLLW